MLPFYYTVVVSTKKEEKNCAEAARESVDVDKKRYSISFFSCFLVLYQYLHGYTDLDSGSIWRTPSSLE